ncbi:ABC-type oligopeptide transport system, periplasmic component [Amylolactobacillus amylotrophicus DSM 20534]|uniref:ABC-type oligopeptide transport system, periplasmic component n=3 Tax=Amylolactobacillus TaxID=2767876 RepID=A0A0R1YM58_9LACO|nr:MULTISPECIES: peptide ABC transporter substrate-binding protein [Amylolactobacillus]APT18522.1 peptide ABC transporter substrate-binding protein [Amylolactobacillus amylophilus DSM 20533 = JCM 1125]KRK37584.1 ABC-type oligopeptide transport system, periplasmic component [Amylolactobacillus amylotrophicus DSM 20534]KRM43560.1 ABC-type oligopeptide transport system, periplasmic component [Amylolactobacillus amylophilus DSM 20533 = JCM 1125]GED80349.1 peptide ABC transporter substrate-binding p
MKKKRLALFGLVTVAATLALTACSNGGSSASNSDKQVWRRMEGDIIASMDSSTITDAIAGQALVDTMDGLYRYQGSKLQAAVAEKVVEPTNDGLTYTFKLKDTKWSNGDDVTAADFVYAWKRAVDPATKSQYAYLYSGVKNADDIMAGKKKADTLGVEAKDDHTFVVNLERPVPYFGTMLVNPVFFPLNQKVVEKYGDKYGTQSKYLVFNGPFKLTGWNGTNNKWKEVKNKSYWNAKKVKLDEIQVQVIKSADTALSLFQSGKIDDVSISGETAAQMKGDASYVPQKQSTIAYLSLNQQKIPALKNQKIRQAISMAINRKEFVTDVLADGSLPASSMVPDGLAANEDTGKDFLKETKVGDKYTKYNSKKAGQLFTEGLKEVGQSSLTLELLGDDTDGAKKSQEYLQSTLEKNLPNLKVNLASVPFKTRLSRSETQQFDMVISLWGADFPDPITFLDLFTTDSSYNDGKWSNAEYDKLITDSETTNATDPAKRWQNLLDASDVLATDMGVVPLYQRVQAHLVNQKVKNLYYSPANNYNFVGTYLK